MVKRFAARLCTGLVVALVGLSALSPTVARASAAFSHGNGTEESPYFISNCDQLQAINNDLDAFYKLIVNIDCDANDFTHIGTELTPFTGSLDGNNKIIKDLAVDDFGLFGVISTGDVTDLKLDGTVVNGTTNVGSLAGKVTDTGATITNVHSVNGAVSGTSNYIGGLIGTAGAGNAVIEKSSYQGTVSSTGVMGGFIGNASGSAYIYNNYARVTMTVLAENGQVVGGFLGLASSSQIGNSYAIATIDAEDAGINSMVGGFAGLGTGSVQATFADMTYNSGATSVGDFLGQAAGLSINLNYYDDHVNGCASNSSGSGGCFAVDTSSNPNYFKESTNAPLNIWDFENNWEEVDGDYPRLQGETVFSEVSADINGDNINDSYQATVIGVPDAEDNLTVVELNSDTDCSLDPVGSWIDSGAFKADPYYPLQIPKMTAFTVYCPSPGAQVIVTLIYPELYDVSDSVLRFYDDVANEYHNVSGVTFGTRVVNGDTVTTASYTLVDGSENDTDGLLNSVIQDPVGIAINNAPAFTNSGSQGSGSGGSSSEQSGKDLSTTGQSTVPITLTAAILFALSTLGLLIAHKRRT